MADKKDDLQSKKELPEKEEKDIPVTEKLKNYYEGLDYIPYP